MFEELRVRLGLRLIDCGMRLVSTRLVMFDRGQPAVADESFGERVPSSWVEEAHLRSALLDADDTWRPLKKRVIH